MIDNNLICHNSIKGHPAMPTIIIHWRPTTSLYDDTVIYMISCLYIQFVNNIMTHLNMCISGM